MLGRARWRCAVRSTVYSDGTTFARQIGMLPTAGSRADRAMQSALNAVTRARSRLRSWGAAPGGNARAAAPERSSSVVCCGNDDGCLRRGARAGQHA